MKKKDIFWVGLVAALAAAAIVLLIAKNGEGRPPRKAPQVPINNPGEQSDFVTSASESEGR